MQGEHGEQVPPRSWAALSLESKLPLLIGGFLLVATVALSIAGFAAVRRNTIAGAGERLTSITRQFREIFEQQSQQLRTVAAAHAARPELVAFVRDPRPVRSGAALAALRYSGPQSEAVIGTSLRARDGGFSLSNVPDALALPLDSLERELLGLTGAPVDSARVGRFHLIGDAIIYAVITPVEGRAGSWLFLWRRLPLSARTRTQLSQLLGADATLVIGNANDSLWTDLEQVIPGPRGYPAAVAEATLREHDGQRFLTRAAPIAGTRWLVASEMPFDEVLVPVDRYLRQMGSIALLIIALGLFGAWQVSRGITEPLADLTTAATAIARGGVTSLPRIERADEVGRLGAAFGAMAAEVAQARSALEAKVEARTRDLNAAMTQLHETQDALVQREKLATLGQLASGVGHELRNPLGVMTNAVYYLRAVLASQPENVREYLDILHQQIALSEKIVADLLDFTRSRSPHRVPTDLRAVVREQASQLATQGHQGVAIVDELPDDLPAAFADRTQAGQVVGNLLLNAVQAMDGAGTITLRAMGTGDAVRLEVTDTGTGIPSENLARIFEPLFTTKARGIGLGLALSRTLARANGGDLAARNAARRGATFIFTLPLAPGDA